MKNQFVVAIFAVFVGFVTLSFYTAPPIDDKVTGQSHQGTVIGAAHEPGTQNQVVADSRMVEVGKVLFVFLVLSVVFESALTPIFNWRLFVKHLSNKGWKTPITVILAIVVFSNYNLDIIRDLLNALDPPANGEYPFTFAGKIFSAFLIAGGSAGILEIYKKLKIRDPRGRLDEVEETEKANAAKDGSKKKKQPNKP